MRSSLPLSVTLVGTGVNITVDGDDLGDSTDIAPDDGTQGNARGVDAPVGARYAVTVQALDPAGFTTLEANRLELLTVTFNYDGGTSAAVDRVGFTVKEDVNGDPTTRQGWTLTGSGFGSSVGDVLTLAPALP